MTLLALNVLPRLADATGWRFPEDPALAILLGVLTAAVLLHRHLVSVWESVGAGFVQGLLAAGATCSVVGFGSALQDLPSFKGVIDWVTHLPVDPLVGAALAVAVIAGLAGSASGGQSLALPILKPIYVDELGVAPRNDRVVAIASGSLDTLPANGYLVVLIRTICGETHARTYWPIFVTTAFIPLLGTILAIRCSSFSPRGRGCERLGSAT